MSPVAYQHILFQVYIFSFSLIMWIVSTGKWEMKNWKILWKESVLKKNAVERQKNFSLQPVTLRMIVCRVLVVLVIVIAFPFQFMVHIYSHVISFSSFIPLNSQSKKRWNEERDCLLLFRACAEQLRHLKATNFIL